MIHELTDHIHLYTRDEWDARPGRKTQLKRQNPQVHEAFLHHTADKHAALYATLDAQKLHMRQIQNEHMDTNGWGDIGYSYVVFQPGAYPYARIFQGRPRIYIPAAQEGHNIGTMAIAVVGDFNHDKLDPNTRFAIEKLLRRYPSVDYLGLHKDVYPTECPGKHIEAALPQILKATDLRRYHR